MSWDPEAPIPNLEEVSYTIIWKPTRPAVNRNVSAFPLAHAIKRAKPHAAISGRENRPGSGTRQALIRGNGSDREIAKAIEPVLRGDRDVAFTIFEQPGDELPGQSVRLRIHSCTALVQTHEAA